MRASLYRLSLAGATALLFALPAFAEKADHDKPTNIEYDHSFDDDLRQIYTWTGNVVLTKGTIVIRCDKLVVTRDPEGYQTGTATMDHPGKRVYFHEKREGYADQWIEGEAERIVYDEKADRVDLFDNAVVRTLDGTTLQDQVSGSKIIYHDDTEQYQVESAGSDDRARARFPPRATPSPAPSNGPAGTAPSTPPGQTAPSPTSSSNPQPGSAVKLELSDTLKSPPHE